MMSSIIARDTSLRQSSDTSEPGTFATMMDSVFGLPNQLGSTCCTFQNPRGKRWISITGQAAHVLSVNVENL